MLSIMTFKLDFEEPVEEIAILKSKGWPSGHLKYWKKDH